MRKARSAMHCSVVSRCASTDSRFSVSVSLTRHSTAIAPCPTAYMHCSGGSICSQKHNSLYAYFLIWQSVEHYHNDNTHTHTCVTATYQVMWNRQLFSWNLASDRCLRDWMPINRNHLSYHPLIHNGNMTFPSLMPVGKHTHAPTVNKWRILLVHSFTAHMPLLMATSSFGLERRLLLESVM